MGKILTFPLFKIVFKLAKHITVVEGNSKVKKVKAVFLNIFFKLRTLKDPFSPG